MASREAQAAEMRAEIDKRRAASGAHREERRERYALITAERRKRGQWTTAPEHTVHVALGAVLLTVAAFTAALLGWLA